MKSTDLVKYGSKPEMMFRVTLNPDGTTYQKEVSLVFPKYVSADLPHYKDEYVSDVQGNASEKCHWHFELED